MAKSMTDQLNLFDPKNFEPSDSATSLLELVDGLMRSDLLDGRMSEEFGPDPVPVNRGAMPTYGRVAAKATPIRGIFGQPGFGSSRSAVLQSSLVNRLRVRLDAVGSTKCSATWNHWTTPAGRSVCQRAVSELIMVGVGYGGWPTPAARDGKDISRSNAFLSQILRHSPSMATRWLSLGRPWQVITAVYCLAMGYPSSWNETRLKATAMPSSRKSRKSSSKPT